MTIKATKKPITVEALRWDGNNLHEVQAFVGAGNWRHEPCGNYLGIVTLEGEMMATQGDYIIKGIKGEFYPRKPDIFLASYNPHGCSLEPIPGAAESIADGLHLVNPNSFSSALEQIKRGRRVTRTGWNGKDQFVFLYPGRDVETALTAPTGALTQEFLASRGGTLRVAGCLTLFNAQGVLVPGWAPSQGDLLANDWELLPE